MKTFELKRDSWHYKAASFASSWIQSETNICSYAWKVLIGCSLIALMSTIVIFLASVTGYGLASAAWALFTGGEFSELAKGVLFGLALLIVLFTVPLGVIATQEKFQKWKNDVAEQENPGFLFLLYKKFKDKTCARIILK